MVNCGGAFRSSIPSSSEPRAQLRLVGGGWRFVYSARVSLAVHGATSALPWIIPAVSVYLYISQAHISGRPHMNFKVLNRNLHPQGGIYQPFKGPSSPHCLVLYPPS